MLHSEEIWTWRFDPAWRTASTKLTLAFCRGSEEEVIDEQGLWARKGSLSYSEWGLRAASINEESRLGLDKPLPSSSARTACATGENSKFCGNCFYKQLIHFSTLNPKPWTRNPKDFFQVCLLRLKSWQWVVKSNYRSCRLSELNS